MRKIRWYVSPILVAMTVALVMCGCFYDCAVYFATIVLHELFHAQVSVRLGYALDRFVLMPYGAGLKGEFEGASARDEIVIALAGPLFNAALAVTVTALWWIYPPIYAFTDRFVAANVFTAAFNMLPVFPLDGGRALLAALSIKTPRQKAYRRMRIVGYVASPAFAALFAIAAAMGKLNFSFAIVSVFIFVSTVMPDKNSVYRRVYGMAYFSERLKNGLKMTEIMVPDDITLIRLDRMLNTNYFTTFVVVDGNFRKVCEISETQLNELLKRFPPREKVGDVIEKTKSPHENADFTSAK